MVKFSVLLLVTILVFSHLLISSTAAPSTRTQRLLIGSGKLHALREAHQVIADHAEIAEGATMGRIDMETNDYPGTGPNNRHTPPGKA